MLELVRFVGPQHKWEFYDNPLTKVTFFPRLNIAGMTFQRYATIYWMGTLPSSFPSWPNSLEHAETVQCFWWTCFCWALYSQQLVLLL